MSPTERIAKVFGGAKDRQAVAHRCPVHEVSGAGAIDTDLAGWGSVHQVLEVFSLEPNSGQPGGIMQFFDSASSLTCAHAVCSVDPDQSRPRLRSFSLQKAGKNCPLGALNNVNLP